MNNQDIRDTINRLSQLNENEEYYMNSFDDLVNEYEKRMENLRDDEYPDDVAFEVVSRLNDEQCREFLMFALEKISEING